MEQLRGGAIFVNIARCSKLQTPLDKLRIVGGKDQDSDILVYLLDAPGRLKAANIGQGVVHQHNFGMEALHLVDRLYAIPGFPHNFYCLLMAEDRHDSFAEERVSA